MESISADKLTVLSGALLCIIALMRGWVITAQHYEEVCKQRDKMTELATESTAIAERLTRAKCDQPR